MRTKAGRRGLGDTDRRIAAAVAAEPEVHAPEGFVDRVMAAVYREALAGRPVPAQPVVTARTYRRIGLSFILSAAVVAAVLVLPVGALSFDMRPGAAGVVRTAMVGADSLVRGALGGGSRR